MQKELKDRKEGPADLQLLTRSGEGRVGNAVIILGIKDKRIKFKYTEEIGE